MRLALVLALLAAACNGGSELPEPRRPPRVAPKPAAEADTGAFESVRFASVPAGTFGPYVADTKAGGLALWAQTADKGRAWFGITFDEQGQPRVPAHKLGSAPAEVGLAVVEPVPGGFALLSTRREGGRTLLDTLELDPRGKPRGAPIALGAVHGEVVWIDLVTTSHGALALWGVKGPDGADLFAALIGRERVEPKPFAKGARAWQAASFGAGAAVGLALGSRVEVQILDGHGTPSERVELGAAASSDLDMVASDRGLLLAWSERSDGESRVVLAALSAEGKVTRKPTPLAGSLGEQALVRLVPPHESGGNAYLAWENLLERPAEGRDIVLAPVTPGGSVEAPRALLGHAARDGSLPELTATPKGLAALTLARACRANQDCATAPLLPTFVELDAELRVLASEPLRITSLRGDSPDLAWGLSCAKRPCRVLAAQSVSPSPVWAVRAASKKSDFVPAARQVERAGPPRVASLELLAKTEPLADAALARLGASTLAAWVTYFDPTTPWQRLTKPAADGKLDPLRALLQVRAIPEAGAPLSPETITLRAHSLGGVALAPAQAAPNEALLAWTAIDFKQPQVFLTALDDKGKKLRQRMLTRAPGDKSDVAVTGVGDGWLVAWVDERSGDAELYATRVNRLLQNAGPEKRITNAPGAAAEVALLSKGQDVWAAWSDARDKESPGVGDVYVAVLKGADGSLSGSEQRVAKTPKHSRSPALAALGQGAVLAWIEETVSAGGEPGNAEARFVELGADGRPVGSSAPLATRGSPTTLALECGDERCRLLMTLSRDGAQELWVSELAQGKASAPVRLLGLTSPAPLGIAPGISGREVLVADRVAGEGRTRRLLVEWK